MRRTGLESIRRAAHYLLDEAVDAEASGGRLFVPRNPYDFDPKQPWEYCFRLAIHDESPQSRRYWKKYVEIPCNKVLTQGDKIEDYIDIDCQIAASPAQHIATGGLSFEHSGIMGNQQPSGGPRIPKVKPDKPEAGTKGLSKQDKNGLWVANVKGVSICGAYNNGSCTGKCPQNKAHQCNKCLQNSHPASRCGQPRVAKEKNSKASHGLKTKGKHGS